MLLDVFASLAPRKFSKHNGLSKVVESELQDLLRNAKAQGKAVVFMMGGEQPHVLAEKVYLRAPFTDNGLRCGFIRWRESPRASWERERHTWQKRVLLGIQLP